MSRVTCCSHHDAEFAEKVLYPGLEQQGVKCCIHTVHWQVDTYTVYMDIMITCCLAGGGGDL